MLPSLLGKTSIPSHATFPSARAMGTHVARRHYAFPLDSGTARHNQPSRLVFLPCSGFGTVSKLPRMRTVWPLFPYLVTKRLAFGLCTLKAQPWHYMARGATQQQYSWWRGDLHNYVWSGLSLSIAYKTSMLVSKFVSLDLIAKGEVKNILMYAASTKVRGKVQSA